MGRVASDLYLMPEEVERLTGQWDHGSQRRWLTTHGVRHYVGNKGFPMVGRSVVSVMRPLLQIQRVPVLDRLFAGDVESRVYIIDEGSDDSPVKIGQSGGHDGCAFRLASLQTGNPRRLRQVFVGVGGYDLEQFIHKQLAPWRMAGEWFERSPKVAAFVTDAMLYGYRTALEKIMPDPLLCVDVEVAA